MKNGHNILLNWKKKKKEVLVYSYVCVCVCVHNIQKEIMKQNLT